MHNAIFFTNVLRLLNERGMTKHELAKLTGVSISVLSEITNGKGNPTLKTLSAIAEALQTPLALLLESTDIDTRELEDASGAHIPTGLPPGYCRACGTLTHHQAFQVRKWHEYNMAKIRQKS
ncbi:transcriptional regulator (plasmid) [Pseudomonas sp. WOUb67]|uniref:transcriptional regulator n=1 Tax=Pseudomonas sp. WOUb67 TaxID=3161136 RepID=UPI003CF9ECD4